jgi:hypothetical protein
MARIARYVIPVVVAGVYVEIAVTFRYAIVQYWLLEWLGYEGYDSWAKAWGQLDVGGLVVPWMPFTFDSLYFTFAMIPVYALWAALCHTKPAATETI